MLPRSIAALLLLLLAIPAAAGSLGTFAGKVIPPPDDDTSGKWLYVKGRGGTLRRVEISQARYEYSDEVPRAARARVPADDLRAGAVVQVAAEQDGSGEWVARTILFLRLAPQQKLVQSSAR